MNQQILTNCYILIKEKKKYEWYKNNLMTYLDNLKDGNFISNMDSHFSTHNSHGFTNYNFCYYSSSDSWKRIRKFSKILRNYF